MSVYQHGQVPWLNWNYLATVPIHFMFAEPLEDLSSSPPPLPPLLMSLWVQLQKFCTILTFALYTLNSTLAPRHFVSMPWNPYYCQQPEHSFTPHPWNSVAHEPRVVGAVHMWWLLTADWAKATGQTGKAMQCYLFDRLSTRLLESLRYF